MKSFLKASLPRLLTTGGQSPKSEGGGGGLTKKRKLQSYFSLGGGASLADFVQSPKINLTDIPGRCTGSAGEGGVMYAVAFHPLG